MTDLRPLGAPGYFYESPRWHDGKWWVSDFYGRTVSTIDASGTLNTVVEVPAQPSGLGWLPDGSLLIVSMGDRTVLRLSHGELSMHADLSEYVPGFANDMVVSAVGNAYVGNFGFDLADPEAEPASTVLVKVTPRGEASVVADGLWFPNGAMITADGGTLIVNETMACRHTAFSIAADGSLTDPRVWAQIAPAPERPSPTLENVGYAPDGGCIDVEGCIWACDPIQRRLVRLAEGGQILSETVMPEGLSAFACALGGEDGRTMLIAAAPDPFPPARMGVTESILFTTEVAVPGIGS